MSGKLEAHEAFLYCLISKTPNNSSADDCDARCSRIDWPVKNMHLDWFLSSVHIYVRIELLRHNKYWVQFPEKYVHRNNLIVHCLLSHRSLLFPRIDVAFATDGKARPSFGLAFNGPIGN